MSDFARWCSDLERALTPSSEDETLEIEVVKDLALRAREIGPLLDEDQREQLMRGVEVLHRVVSEGLARVGDDLATLGRQRRGIRGYGQLRSNHVSQRLHRRA